MNLETIYTSDGKAFPREFRKFGDICLTETNERIFVCSLCKCLSVTPAQFWKHQRDEHEIREYKDTVVTQSKQPNGEEHQSEVEQSKQSSGSNSCPSTNTRSSLKIVNGSAKPSESKSVTSSGQATPPNPPLKPQKQPKDSEKNDSPLLKRALKQPPRIKTLTQGVAEQEELNEASSSSDNNLNEFISFCCPQCGKRFQSDVQWKEHTATVHNFFAADQLNISLHKVNPDGSKVFKCEICNVLLNKPNIAPLRRHKLIHMPFKSYCCRLCGTKIRHKSGIVHHVRSVHRKGKQKLLKCRDCLKTFQTELQYKKHFKLESCGMVLDLTGEALLPADMETNTVDDGLGFLNGMSENCNYNDGVSFDEVPADDADYDASAFLETEMIEDDAQDEELFAQSIGVHVKEEPTEYTADNGDLFTTLWQEDAALIAEQRMQRAVYDGIIDTNVRSNNVGSTAATNYECTVCWKFFASKSILAKHLRGHGRKMDCRRCGVQISSIKALRRHLDLKRCKILTAKDLGKKKRNSAKLKRNLRSTKEAPKSKERHNDHLERKEQVADTAPSRTTATGAFNCEDCNASLETRIMLSLHGARSHGKTDCRFCGVKISTPGALRRHYDLKRCKAFK